MLAISNTKKFLGFHGMLRCYDRKSLVANLSFRTERDQMSHQDKPIPHTKNDDRVGRKLQD